MILKKIISNKHSIKIFALFFILMLLSDFLMKLNLVYQIFPFFRFSGVLKITFQLYLLLFAFKNKINKRFVYLILILTSSFFIGQFFLVKNSIFDNNLLDEFLKGDIYHLNKYFFIILFVAVIKEYSCKIELSKSVINTLIIVLSLNSILILIGFVFDVNLFQSFPGSTRFGYSGLFVKSGESTLLYLLISIYFYIQFLKGKHILPVIYFVIIALLSGKKIAFLIIPLFYLIHFCIQSKYKTVFIFLGVSITGLVLIFKKIIIEYIVSFFPFWEKLLEERGFWTVIFSTRDLNFHRTFDYINQNWLPINYLFGGTSYNHLRIEIDPFDLFVFFGIVGSLSYMFFIYKCFFNVLRNRTIKLLIIGYVVIGMIYGAFLFNILLMTLLYLFIITCDILEKE
ncbi:MAG: hypothetical protein QNK89_03000 [Lacinutrix sp.]|uniref:hypothetical protein n=1 Tax=Lacinutrix sp. TaxID=1937692 RepID=UPI0030999864